MGELGTTGEKASMRNARGAGDQGAVRVNATAGSPSRASHQPPKQIRDMFAAIVPRYDTVNSLMTLGLDRRWRRTAVAMAEPRGAIALDIATGTGELAFELIRQGARVVFGADFCL